MGREGRLGPCLEGAVQWQAAHVIRFQSWALEVSKLKVTAPGASPPTHLFPLSQASECFLKRNLLLMEARYVNQIRAQLFLLAHLSSLLLKNASLSPWRGQNPGRTPLL